MTIKVLIADDHQLFREGLVNLISSAPDIEVIGEAKDGLEATKKAKN
jgi:two-component system, NarL family, response regulator NreC